MLVLTRKRDENIVCEIPEFPALKIRVLEIRPNSVRIGIEAAGEIRVWREEILPLHGTSEAAIPAGCAVITEGEKVL